MIPCGEGSKSRSRAGEQEDGRRRPFAIAFVLIVLVLSGLYLYFTWHRYEGRAVSTAITLAQSMEAMLQPEHIAVLTGRPEDQKKPEYNHIKDNLMRLVDSTDPIRFAYLMIQRDGRIVFAMDSEPADSPDYSPPGQGLRRSG